MRIHSSFKDYYDGAVRQYDPAPTPFWSRQTRMETIPVPPGVGKRRERSSIPSSTVRWEEPFGIFHDLWRAFPVPKGGHHQPVFERILVVVCGRIFPVYHCFDLSWLGPKALLKDVESGDLARALLEAEASREDTSLSPCGRTSLICELWGYDFEKSGKPLYTWERIQRRLLVDFGIEAPDSTERRSVGRHFGLYEATLDPKSAAAFEDLFSTRNVVEEKIHAHPLVRSPIFAIRNLHERDICPGLEIDPDLGSFGMASFLPPSEAWQLIDRAFNGPLSSSPEVPSTTGGDEVVRDAKGFDNWSFKRHRDDPKSTRPKKRK